MKTLLCILCAVVVVSCASSNENFVTEKPTPVSNAAVSNPESGELLEESSNSELVGGWAPAFFNSYDEPQLVDIAQKMNDGVVKKIVISYPKKMQPLAAKIQSYLQKKTAQSIQMNVLDLQDTDQVSYNMTQVILTLYF